MEVSNFTRLLESNKIKVAKCVEDFESCLSEVLLKLNETGIPFSLKKEPEMAVLPTGFAKSLIFRLFVSVK